VKQALLLFFATSLTGCNAVFGIEQLEQDTSSSGTGGNDAGAPDGSGGLAGAPGCPQTAGDCKRNVCDGQGNVTVANDDSDPKNDGNECTDDKCNGGTPENAFLPDTTPCGAGAATHCDGAGKCVGCSGIADCPKATCTQGVEQPQDLCDDSGVCVDSGSKPCAPFTCGSTACKTSCSDSGSDCQTGYFCSNGACLVKKSAGESCEPTLSGADCSTNFCVDGVCCKSTCDGKCQTCSGVKAGGLPTTGDCWPVAALTDPDDECSGGRACDGNGACSGVLQCNCAPQSPGPSMLICCAGASCSNCLDQSSQCAAGLPCNSNAAVTNGYLGPGNGSATASGECASGYKCAVWSCTCVP
jgi:hypothetical protein